MNIRQSLRIAGVVAALVLVASAHANEVDRERIENIRIAGVAISDGAEAGFNTLVAAGYQTDVDNYADWRQAARSFVKGDVNSPNSSPDGYTEVILERNGHRLRAVRLTYINMRSPFDADAAVERVRSALGLPSDAPSCGVVGGNGVCVAEDSDGLAGYFLQVLSSRQRYEGAELLDVPAVGLGD